MIDSSQTIVIAEIGVNHDGQLQRALQLVEVAAACGADAVKLQIFQAANLMHASGGFAEYQKEGCTEDDPSAMLRKYELSHQDIFKIVQEIRHRGMMPIATPFSLPDVKVIAELDLPAIKIASPDLVNKPLLAEAAKQGKPMMISTGAATMAEVRQAVGWLHEWNASFAILHCISSYPTRGSEANLSWIAELAELFEEPVGYSDHTTEVLAGALAVAAGATIVEKHLTYDRAAVGPDHSASADPEQYSEYVRLIRKAEQLRGNKGKRVLECEEDVRKVSRQSVVLRRTVATGEQIDGTDLIIQRPGTGIPAAMRDRVVGLAALHPISAGTILQWSMLSNVA